MAVRVFFTTLQMFYKNLAEGQYIISEPLELRASAGKPHHLSPTTQVLVLRLSYLLMSFSFWELTPLNYMTTYFIQSNCLAEPSAKIMQIPYSALFRFFGESKLKLVYKLTNIYRHY